MKSIYLIIVYIVFISMNLHAQEWNRILFKGDSSYDGVHNIILNPLNPQTLYAGTYNTGKFYRSFDAGKTWDSINTYMPPIRSFSSMQVSPSDTNIIIAASSLLSPSIFRSTDRGITWKSIALPSFKDEIQSNMEYAVNSESIIFDPEEPSTVYLGIWAHANPRVEAWFCKSTDNGASWDTIYNFTTNHKVYALCGLTMNKQNVLFQGAVGGGIFRSTDKGKSWAKVYEPDDGNITAKKTPMIKFSYNNPNIGFATQTNAQNYKGGCILKTVDGGKSWFRIISGDTSYWALELTEVGDKMEVITSAHQYSMLNSFPYIIQSINGGFNWNNIDDLTIPWPKLNSDRSANKILYHPQRPRGVKYFMAMGNSLLTYTPPGSTDVQGDDEKNRHNSIGLDIQYYLQTIRLRLDIKYVTVYSITGELSIHFDMLNDGDHISEAIKGLPYGTYYAIVTTNSGNQEYQSLIQY